MKVQISDTEKPATTLCHLHFTLRGRRFSRGLDAGHRIGARRRLTLHPLGQIEPMRGNLALHALHEVVLGCASGHRRVVSLTPILLRQ